MISIINIPNGLIIPQGVDPQMYIGNTTSTLWSTKKLLLPGDHHLMGPDHPDAEYLKTFFSLRVFLNGTAQLKQAYPLYRDDSKGFEFDNLLTRMTINIPQQVPYFAVGTNSPELVGSHLGKVYSIVVYESAWSLIGLGAHLYTQNRE